MRSAVADLLAASGLDSTAAQLEALAQFVELLQRWNTTYNLTALRNADLMLVSHLSDCLAAISTLQRKCSNGSLLDVGSGGGLPGLVFAIMLPRLQVTCLDAVGKKAAFVRQAAASLQLTNLEAVHARVESWHGGPFDVVASRAFSSLPEFVSLSRHLLKPTGVWMAMKAKIPHAEIERLLHDVAVFHVEPLEVPGLNAKRCLVWLRSNAK